MRSLELVALVRQNSPLIGLSIVLLYLCEEILAYERLIPRQYYRRGETTIPK